jgi:hypothetical protein
MQSNKYLSVSSVSLPSISSDLTLMLNGSAPNYTGYGSPLSDAGQVGIDLTNKNDYLIQDVTFKNINGTAVKVQGGANSGGWQHVGHIDHVVAAHSYYGFRFYNSAEYETVSDCQAYNCVFGFQVESGNNSFSNCKATYCSIGVKIAGGVNNGHGVWNGLISNHNTYNLTCQDVTLGEHFVGCCFIGGQGGADQGYIQIISSKGITFTGGQIGYQNITIDANSQVMFHGVTFRGPVNFTVSAGGTLIAKDNLVMAGAAITLNGVAWAGNN